MIEEWSWVQIGEFYAFISSMSVIIYAYVFVRNIKTTFYLLRALLASLI